MNVTDTGRRPSRNQWNHECNAGSGPRQGQVTDGCPRCEERLANALSNLPNRYEIDFDSGCWRWIGALSNGYGKFSFNGYQRLVHRSVYELVVEPIPAGMQLDHLCRVRDCVNPDHLEVVTPQQNTLRGQTRAAANSAKTHCPQGHALVETNLVRCRQADGRRRCLTCQREANRDWARRNPKKRVSR